MMTRDLMKRGPPETEYRAPTPMVGVSEAASNYPLQLSLAVDITNVCSCPAHYQGQGRNTYAFTLQTSPTDAKQLTWEIFDHLTQYCRLDKEYMSEIKRNQDKNN